MHRLRIGLAIGVAAVCVGIVGGTAFGVADEQAGEASDVGPMEALYSGVTVGGKAYEISRVQTGSEGVCFRLTSDRLAAQPCLALPPEQPVSDAVRIMLDEDVFVLALARDGIETLRVTRLDGRGVGTPIRPVDLGPVRLLHAVFRAPQATLPVTDFGLPVPPAVKVEALDADRAPKVQEIVASRLHGKGYIEEAVPGDE